MIVSRFSPFYSIDSLLEYEFDTKESIELYKSYLITDIHQKHSSKNATCDGNDSLYESRFFYDLIVYMDYLIGRLYSKTLRFQQQILINHLLISMNTYLYLPLQNR